MGKHLQNLFSFRTENEIIDKINFIAKYNTRTRNKEVEHVLKKHIANFEEEHGELVMGEDGNMTIAKPTPVSKDKSSSSRTG